MIAVKTSERKNSAPFSQFIPIMNVFKRARGRPRKNVMISHEIIFDSNPTSQESNRPSNTWIQTIKSFIGGDRLSNLNLSQSSTHVVERDSWQSPSTSRRFVLFFLASFIKHDEVIDADQSILSTEQEKEEKMEEKTAEEDKEEEWKENKKEEWEEEEEEEEKNHQVLLLTKENLDKLNKIRR